MWIAKCNVILLGWLVSIVIAGLAGYHWRLLVDRVAVIEQALKARVSPSKTPVASSVVYDPLDVVQMTRIEHERMLARLSDANK